MRFVKTNDPQRSLQILMMTSLSLSQPYLLMMSALISLKRNSLFKERSENALSLFSTCNISLLFHTEIHKAKVSNSVLTFIIWILFFCPILLHIVIIRLQWLLRRTVFVIILQYCTYPFLFCCKIKKMHIKLNRYINIL